MGSNPAFAQAAAINVCGIPEIDTRLVGGIKNGIGGIIAHGPEIATELPAPKTNF